MLSTTQRYALAAERWTVEKLRSLGYDARLLSLWTTAYDILINGLLPCEVKIAHPRKYRTGRTGQHWRHRYQFNLSGNNIVSDYVLVAICDAPTGWMPFIIPSQWIMGRQMLQITQLYPEQYAGYVAEGLNNWGLIETVLRRSQKYLQLTLPQKGELQWSLI